MAFCCWGLQSVCPENSSNALLNRTWTTCRYIRNDVTTIPSCDPKVFFHIHFRDIPSEQVHLAGPTNPAFSQRLSEEEGRSALVAQCDRPEAQRAAQLRIHLLGRVGFRALLGVPGSTRCPENHGGDGTGDGSDGETCPENHGSDESCEGFTTRWCAETARKGSRMFRVGFDIITTTLVHGALHG